MDTQSFSAQELHPAAAGSHDDHDEAGHETTAPRRVHVVGSGHGHAEDEAELASLPSDGSHQPDPAAPLHMPGEHEHDPEAVVGDRAPLIAATPTANVSTRNALIGTAVAFVVMVGGTTAYMLSHGRHAVPVAAAPAWHPQQIVRGPADPVGTTAMVPSPTHTETDDILGMRHGSQPMIPANVPAPKPSQTAVVAPPPAIPAPAAVVVAPVASTAQATPAHLDPVTVALAMRPGPMTPPQVVDVLSEVTQMAAMMRDMRTQNAQLRDKIAALDDAVKAETSDVSLRLGLMESGKALASAESAGTSQGPASGSGSTREVGASATPASTSVAVVPVPVPLPAAIRSVRDYRVQAASPGLAILADANAAPGHSAGLQVAVGDLVPGVGRITNISQRGTTWVVQTNHGVIQ